MKHHFRDSTGSNYDPIDAAEWNCASYFRHPCEDMEPLDDAPNAYRSAALECVKVLHAIDEFVLASQDPWLAWIGVALALRLTSVRGLTIVDIAEQLGVTTAAINRCTARFAQMANLDHGGIRLIRPGSNSNGA